MSPSLRQERAAWRQLLAQLGMSVGRSVRPRSDAIWLVMVTGLAAVVRAYSLQQPLWYDEAYTFLNFVQRGFPALLNYPVPNNHVLHTILVRLATVLLPPDPVSIRMPAFLAGVAVIPLTFLLCRTLRPGRSGYLAATGAAVLPYLVLYSTLSRGYSLLVVWALALAWVGLHVVRKPSLFGCAVLSVIGGLGMLTIPTMLFALGGIYVWLAGLRVLETRSLRVFRELLVPCALMTAVATLALYAPSIVVSGGTHTIVANSFVQPLPWSEFAPGILPHVSAVVFQFAWEVPSQLPLLCGGLALALIGMVAAAGERNWAVALLVPSMLAGSALVLFAKQSIPFVRAWIYLIPFAFVAADAGLTAVLARLPRIVRKPIPVLFAAAAAYGAIALIADDAIARSADFADGPRVGRDLKMLVQPGDAVRVKLPIDWQTYFYLDYYGVPHTTEAAPGRHEYFVVDRRSYAVTDLTGRPVVVVAEYEQTTLYRSQDSAP